MINFETICAEFNSQSRFAGKFKSTVTFVRDLSIKSDERLILWFNYKE